MTIPLLTVAIRYENDVVLARQRARQLAESLGFDASDQVRVATAISEIARNAFQYATRGKVEFAYKGGPPPLLQIRVSDQGPGIADLHSILQGKYKSKTGMGIGILGARRLMDEFQIESAPHSGTTVTLAKRLPQRSASRSKEEVTAIIPRLVQQQPEDPYAELQTQNQELLATLEELERRQKELAQLNKELEDTNRGVVALYAELDEKADFLRRASEMKTQFLSNMTHEFRTPLNSILGLSRILLERIDGELTTEQERQVRFIQKAANDLSELVNDLLDLAKVQAGRITIRATEFEVKDLFSALRGMLRPLLAHNSSVKLIFETSDQIPPLHTDESKVSQVLRNLISNALKYTERGEIRVSARLEPENRISFNVTDTGIGIAPEDQDRIFEDFTQIEGPHQVGKKGTGLGLPLSKRLAELLGGSLTVKSQSGQGSAFTLLVPMSYTGEDGYLFNPERATELDRNRLPVLVVEDNRETQLLYDKYLKGTAFQAIPARTLKQAHRAIEQFQPIAIILDILLARESTWTFLSDVKQRDSTRRIPVFVVTMVDNRHKALAMGADAFHTKPLDRQWLLDKLSECAGRQSRPDVLIVDDDEASRYILRGFLKETCCNIIEAENGEIGLQLARERRPAAIILDIIMPGLSGIDVLENLKGDPLTKHIPVVIHTSKTLTEQERQRIGNSAVAIIPKRYNNREFSATSIAQALFIAGVSGIRQSPEAVTV